MTEIAADKIREAAFILRCTPLELKKALMPNRKKYQTSASPLKAWAIVHRNGPIQINTIRENKAECWAVVSQQHNDAATSILEQKGYRCIRIVVSAVNP